MDFVYMCLVTKLTGNLESKNCPDWWDNSEVNNWTNWDLRNNDQIMAWQYSINKHFSAVDSIMSCWLKDFVYMSSTNSLQNAINKKYNKLTSNCHGGVSSISITLCARFVHVS